MVAKRSRMYRVAALFFAFASLVGTLPATAQAGDPAQAPVAMGNARMVRGTITAVAPDKLTVKTEQGDLFSVAISANTQVRKGREPMKLADVHVGDGVGAMGEIDQPSKTVHALFVSVVTAEDLKKAREAMGKTFISGTVTAIDDLKLTVKRTDDVVQVIAVDEDTSFRRGARGMQMALGADGPGGGSGNGYGGGRRGAGTNSGSAAGQGAPGASASPGAPEGEPLTLADVKVGSVVAGPGSIKNGIFVAKTLGVAEPGAQRQRRRPDPGGPTPAPAPAPAKAPATPATPPMESN